MSFEGDPEAARDIIQRHHHAARVRLGCRAMGVDVSDSANSPRAGGYIFSDSAGGHPVVLYTHDIYPWRYFNHAIVPGPADGNAATLARAVTRRMLSEDRSACFEVEIGVLTASMSAGSAVSEPTQLASSKLAPALAEWASVLIRTGYSPIDELLVMGRSLSDTPLGTAGCAPVPPKYRPGAVFKPGGYCIQTMNERDLSRQVSLHRRGFGVRKAASTNIDRALLRTNLEGGVEYLWGVEERSGQPIGSAALFAIGDAAELFALSVIPPHRNRGVGRMLVTGAMERAREAGCRLLYLQSAPGSIPTRLYRQLGFEPLWYQVSFTSGANDHRI